MQLLYSKLVDPSEYDMDGISSPELDLRISKYADFEEIGTIRAQEDWRKYVGPVEPYYRGGLGPKYNFMAIAVPECLPERLEIISYANEFAFLYDDMVDNVSKEEGDKLNDQLMAAFQEAATTGKITQALTGKRYVQAQMLLEMMAIDKPRALVAMKAWAEFAELASGREHFTDFASLDQYIPYRILDVGEMFWFGMLTFGMGLTIKEEEIEECRLLSRDAYIIFGLQNDLYSWDKEVAAAEKIGQKHVVNAVYVIMKEHGVGVDDAKQICRRVILEHEAKYIKTLREVEKRTDLSHDLKRFVEALQYSSTGNVLWSVLCPRYHADYYRMNHGAVSVPPNHDYGLKTIFEPPAPVAPAEPTAPAAPATTPLASQPVEVKASA
ncbi:isoprenoid synthase domain-containing protein [Macrophomina phaseolina]|uniref:Isoprenoid synthase domain-containing protein n=1 Tax=Macrophomina phaseolina TaxID=35725 RepID=A0ABQ8GBU4_9PEZI|nr:isoprenoid synthase domain-containing protein [Macrophomina phaseolina]